MLCLIYWLKIPDQMDVTLLYNMLFMIATYIVECYNDVTRSALVEFRKIHFFKEVANGTKRRNHRKEHPECKAKE